MNEIIEKTLTTAPEYRNLLTIRDNTDRLLNLVNQLLDFRNVSSQNHAPVFVRSDLSQIIGSVISRFAPSSKIKGITIDPHVPEGFRADVDVEMFVKMTSNLMNNALKHARTRIVVDLLIDDNAQDFLLTVPSSWQDAGIIDKKYLEGYAFSASGKKVSVGKKSGNGVGIYRRKVEVYD